MSGRRPSTSGHEMRRTARLPIFIDRRVRGSLQHQIYRCVRQSIREGLIDPGGCLPSTRALAADLRVSRITVLLALEQLRAEGYLIARPGSGTFVASRLPEHQRPVAKPLANSIAHPPFSQRGHGLARMVAPDRRRLASGPCAFRLGTPALDLFPRQLWSSLTRECLRALKPTQLDYC